LDDKKEARADGGRRFQREGPAHGKGTRFSHNCPSPMDKEVPPVKGA